MLSSCFSLLTEAAVPVAEAVSSLAEIPLFTKGLLVTVMGLCGVFLVLTLFFITIKLMQRIRSREQ